MIPGTCGICVAVTEISSWKELKLVPSLSHSSLLLAYILMKIEYAVALFPMIGYRMAQESSQYHLRFRTYAGRKNSLLLLLLLLILLLLILLLLLTYYDYD